MLRGQKVDLRRRPAPCPTKADSTRCWPPVGYHRYMNEQRLRGYLPQRTYNCLRDKTCIRSPTVCQRDHGFSFADAKERVELFKTVSSFIEGQKATCPQEEDPACCPPLLYDCTKYLKDDQLFRRNFCQQQLKPLKFTPAGHATDAVTPATYLVPPPKSANFFGRTIQPSKETLFLAEDFPSPLRGPIWSINFPNGTMVEVRVPQTNIPPPDEPASLREFIQVSQGGKAFGGTTIKNQGRFKVPSTLGVKPGPSVLSIETAGSDPRVTFPFYDSAHVRHGLKVKKDELVEYGIIEGNVSKSASENYDRTVLVTSEEAEDGGDYPVKSNAKVAPVDQSIVPTHLQQRNRSAVSVSSQTELLSPITSKPPLSLTKKPLKKRSLAAMNLLTYELDALPIRETQESSPRRANSGNLLKLKDYGGGNSTEEEMDPDMLGQSGFEEEDEEDDDDMYTTECSIMSDGPDEI